MARMQYRESEELRNLRKELRKFFKKAGLALDKALDYYIAVLDSNAQDSVKANAAGQIIKASLAGEKSLLKMIEEREEQAGIKKGSVKKAASKATKEPTEDEYEDDPIIEVDDNVSYMHK